MLSILSACCDLLMKCMQTLMPFVAETEGNTSNKQSSISTEWWHNYCIYRRRRIILLHVWRGNFLEFKYYMRPPVLGIYNQCIWFSLIVELSKVTVFSHSIRLLCSVSCIDFSVASAFAVVSLHGDLPEWTGLQSFRRFSKFCLLIFKIQKAQKWLYISFNKSLLVVIIKKICLLTF